MKSISVNRQFLLNCRDDTIKESIILGWSESAIDSITDVIKQLRTSNISGDWDLSSSFLHELSSFPVISDASWINTRTAKIVRRQYWAVNTKLVKKIPDLEYKGFIATLIENNKTNWPLHAFHRCVENSAESQTLKRMGVRTDLSSERYLTTHAIVSKRGREVYAALLRDGRRVDYSFAV